MCGCKKTDGESGQRCTTSKLTERRPQRRGKGGEKEIEVIEQKDIRCGEHCRYRSEISERDRPGDW